MFYGTECPHCVTMHGFALKLEKEEGLKVEELEVWHNKENDKRLMELDKDLCGGVPFLYNLKTQKYICGESDYITFKKWAKGEKFSQD
jgi:hypothetical protein